jgi:hypothetical protein
MQQPSPYSGEVTSMENNRKTSIKISNLRLEKHRIDNSKVQTLHITRLCQFDNKQIVGLRNMKTRNLGDHIISCSSNNHVSHLIMKEEITASCIYHKFPTHKLSQKAFLTQ